MFGRSLGMRRNNLLFAYLMLAPAIIMLVALNIYPFLTALYSSFYSIHTITREASWVGLENFRSLLQSALFWQSFGRSLLWMVPGVSIQLVLGIAISLLLHQELRGRWVARGIVLFPYLVPAIVATLVWRFMFNPLTGVINYLLVDVLSVIDKPIAWLAGKNTALLGVVIVGIWKFVPFMVILFLARLQTTPLELYDAAKIDGASQWQEFWYVTLPWLQPTILVALLLRTLWMFNEFDITYLMAYGGPLYATTTLPVLVRNTAFGLNEMGKAAAISMLMVTVLFAISFVYLRYYALAEEQLSN